MLVDLYLTNGLEESAQWSASFSVQGQRPINRTAYRKMHMSSQGGDMCIDFFIRSGMSCDYFCRTMMPLTGMVIMPETPLPVIRSV